MFLNALLQQIDAIQKLLTYKWLNWWTLLSIVVFFKLLPGLKNIFKITYKI